MSSSTSHASGGPEPRRNPQLSDRVTGPYRGCLGPAVRKGSAALASFLVFPTGGRSSSGSRCSAMIALPCHLSSRPLTSKEPLSEEHRPVLGTDILSSRSDSSVSSPGVKTHRHSAGWGQWMIGLITTSALPPALPPARGEVPPPSIPSRHSWKIARKGSTPSPDRATTAAW